MLRKSIRILLLFSLIFAAAGGGQGDCIHCGEEPKPNFRSDADTDNTDTSDEPGEGEGYLCVLVRTDNENCVEDGQYARISVFEEGSNTGKIVRIYSSAAKVVCCESAENTYCMYRNTFVLELDKIYEITAELEDGREMDTKVLFSASEQAVCIPFIVVDKNLCVCECEPPLLVDGECE